MMRFITPIILIALSITVFFVFTNGIYTDIGDLGKKVASYNDALDNAKSLKEELNKLTFKENSFDPANLAKLQKLLPDNIDNIRLILEIEQIALPYGMVLKDVKYDTAPKKDATTSTAGVIQGGGGGAQATPLNYGVWNLGFSTVGTYNDFVNFTRDLENNLRIVDISSVQFSSDTGGGSASSSTSNFSPTSTSISNLASQSYKYDFQIKTYWLKD